MPRTYPEIVRDALTTLTGGTVRETAVVPLGDVIVLAHLADRPIRRVSHLQGEIELQRPVRDANGDVVLDTNGAPEMETVGVPYRFTDADFELVATGAAGDEHDAIRFRPTGRKPPAGSTVTVNYYPTQTRPTPITDLNVGSVARTMLESVAREIALVELLMENVYRSAFIDTAEGSNLDKVVALVGVKRRPAGVATTRVRFTRAPGSTGQITVPTAAVVADADGNRYATVAPLVLEPGEPSREVLAAGISKSTPAVAANAIDRLEVLIAGIASATNEAPAAVAASAEPDDELRRRARGALAVAARGTVHALKFGLLSIPGVKDVAITEFPNGVPGEIQVDVAYERQGDADLEADVVSRIEELRPAGVRVITAAARMADVRVRVSLTLTGDGVTSTELASLQEDLELRVVDHIRSLPPGGTLRQAQVTLVALSDARVVDASFEFELGGPPSATVTAPTGTVLQPVRPFSFTATTETGVAGLGATIQLDALIPIHLVAGVTLAEATAAIDAAAASYAAGLTGGGSVTVDGLIATLRDDSRFAIVRADVSVTTESVDRFMQLADGIGAQAVGPGDRLVVGEISVDVREGGV
ncbi:putative phage protein gp47/JayE [Humibacillus xanthopallidus]|uniref:Putative phage protein gp47/JayE n=1 Tax=Humibacillus xanthopallidus TaxID=412689 RepID=A0A543PUE6_9MICO|nr:putative phage protein gp47/JayE [Humibacillus xanthopallidus]